jgi:hypothetical protein
VWSFPDAPQEIRVLLNPMPRSLGGVGNACQVYVLVSDEEGRSVGGAVLIELGEGERNRALSAQSFYSGLLQHGATHRFVASAAGYSSAEKAVSCDDNGRTQVNLVLKKK